MQVILTGNVKWSFSSELNKLGEEHQLRGLFSFIPPPYHHVGSITLTESALLIEGDENLSVGLYNMNEVFLGYDEVYKHSYVKNGGIFWQPLRISYNASTIYALIDQNFIGNRNQLWFDTLKQIFSE